jgi:hypothetical protein
MVYVKRLDPFNGLADPLRGSPVRERGIGNVLLVL